jgi:hypothetical protein
LKAEAAAWTVELERRHTKIGKGAVNLADAAGVERGVDFAVVGVDERDAVGPRRQCVTGTRKRVLVAVETNHASGAGLEQRTRMAAEAHRTVDEQPAALGTKMLDHLGGQDGQVVDQMPNSASTRASSSVKGSR